MTQPLEARDLFRAAYENRYTWDKNFPGYTADISLIDPQSTVSGQVRVNSNLSAEVMNVEDEEAKRAIVEQVREIAIHRIRRTFDESHGQNTFAYGETDDTGAVEIIVGGKATGDRYKVRNNEVCMVHRHIHGVVVTIHTFSSHQTGEGYLSHRYDSVYHDASTGEPKGSSEFEDLYEQVGNYWILTQRRITSPADGQPVTREFTFSNVKLLQPVAV